MRLRFFQCTRAIEYHQPISDPRIVVLFDNHKNVKGCTYNKTYNTLGKKTSGQIISRPYPNGPAYNNLSTDTNKKKATKIWFNSDANMRTTIGFEVALEIHNLTKPLSWKKN